MYGKSKKKKKGDSDEPCILEGVFKKMGISKTNSWKKRYFRLRADPNSKTLNLSYYEKKESSKPKGVVVIGIGSTIRKISHPDRKNCFELCAQGNIKLIASAVVPEDCEIWINNIASRISQWANTVLENLKPNISKRLGDDVEAVEKVSKLGPMELLRLVVVAAYHSLCVAGAFVPVPKDKAAAAQATAKHGANAKYAKPVAHFESADFLRWVTEAGLVTTREDAVILGSLILKHGWIRSAAESKGQGKAESSAGSTFETSVGSIYHFVANFGSIIWMGHIRLTVSGGGGGGGGGIKESSSKPPKFEFWQLVTTLDGLHLQRLTDQASGIIVSDYYMHGFSAVDLEGDALRFRLERRGGSGDNKTRFDIECESSTAKKYCFKAISSTLKDLAQIKQAIALDKDMMMGLIRAKTSHDLLTITAEENVSGAIPVVDAAWAEACTSTVQQLVPIFEGELYKQPKSVTKEGKKGKQKDEKVMDTAKFQSRYFRLHLDVQIQWATQYGVYGKLYKAIKKKRAKFLKKLAKKAGEAPPKEDSSDEDAFGSDEEDVSGDTCRPFAYLSYFKTSSTLIPQGVIAINRKCVVERIRQAVQDRSYLFKLKTDNAKTNQLVVDVGKSAGYRDRWIGAISNTITAATELESDAEFLDTRKRAEEVPVVSEDPLDALSMTPRERAASQGSVRSRSSSVSASPAVKHGGAAASTPSAATITETNGEVYKEWVQLLCHKSVMEKKIIPWQKRYMVLRVHEPGAATSGDEEEWSTISFFENDTDTEPKEFFRFLSKDCFKMKKYKSTQKYSGKPNVFKLRFFKKVINAYAKARKDKKSKIKHSINLYVSFSSWKRCTKWMDRIKDVAEHVEKKSAFGDFLADWDGMTIEEREAEACEIALSHLEAAQDDVERSLGFDFDELCNDVEEHKEALEKSAEEVTVNRKQSVNLDTSETAVFSLDDFGDLEIEDTSAQDNVKAKLQHFLFRLTSSLIHKLVHDLREQFKDFAARSRIDVFMVFFNEYWKLAVRFLQEINFEVDDDTSSQSLSASRYSAMPKHRKIARPSLPEGVAPHESGIVDELLEVLARPHEPFKAWGANEVLDILAQMSAFWLFFQTSCVSQYRQENGGSKRRGPVAEETFVIDAPKTVEKLSFAGLGGDDSSEDEDELSSDDDEDAASSSPTKPSSLYGTRPAAKNENEVRVELFNLNSWIHYFVQLFLPRYKQFFANACTNTAKTVLNLHAPGGPKLDALKSHRNGTVGTTYPFDLTTIMYNQYTNLLKHKCLHVNGLVAGVVAIHGGGMMLIQQKFLDEYDEICEQLMDLEAKATNRDSMDDNDKKRRGDKSYLYFLVALVNDCLLCKDKVFQQKRVFDGNDAEDDDDDLPTGTTGGAQSSKKVSEAAASPTGSPVRAAGKQLTPQATSATAKLKTVVSGYLEEVFQEFDFPEEFRSRSLMGNQRDYTQYQAILEEDLQDISGEMISKFIHFLFDKTNRFPHFLMLGTKEAWVFDDDAKKLAQQASAEEAAREAAARGEGPKEEDAGQELVNDLKEVGNDIKNAFENLGKSDVFKQMQKGFQDLNMSIKQSAIGKTFDKIAESPDMQRLAANLKRTQELTRRRLPLRRGPDAQSNCLKLALSELSAFYYGSIAQKLHTGLVAYILPIITNRLTVGYLHGLQKAITTSDLRLTPSDIADDVARDDTEEAPPANRPKPFLSEEGRASELFRFECGAPEVKKELSLSFEAFNTVLRSMPKRTTTAKAFRNALAGCLRPQVAKSPALDAFLVEHQIVPESGTSQGGDDSFTFDYDRAVQSLQSLHQKRIDAEAAPDAWKRKTVCGEVDAIDQALFGMALASYGVEKAHRRYYQLVWPRLGVLDDWRCMLKVDVKNLGKCCDIGLNRISNAPNEMHLGKSYADGVYLAAKTVVQGRNDCLALDEDSMMLKDQVIRNCYIKAQCLYTVNAEEQVVDAALSLVQDDVYARIFPETLDPSLSKDTLPSEQKPLGAEQEPDPAPLPAPTRAPASNAAATAGQSGGAKAAAAAPSSSGSDSNATTNIARQTSDELKRTCRFVVRSCDEQHPVFKPSTRTYTIGCDFGKTSKTITRTYVQIAEFLEALVKELNLEWNERPRIPMKPDTFRRKTEVDNVKEMQAFIDTVVSKHFFGATFQFFDLNPNEE